MTISSAFEMAAIEALKGALVSRAPGMLGSPDHQLDDCHGFFLCF